MGVFGDTATAIGNARVPWPFSVLTFPFQIRNAVNNAQNDRSWQRYITDTVAADQANQSGGGFPPASGSFAGAGVPLRPPMDPSRAPRPSSMSARERLLSLSPELIMHPEFDTIAKRLGGDPYTLKPGEGRFEDSRQISGVAPLPQVLSQGQQQRDASGNLLGENPPRPLVAGEGSSVFPGAVPNNGLPFRPLASVPKTFAPGSGGGGPGGLGRGVVRKADDGSLVMAWSDGTTKVLYPGSPDTKYVRRADGATVAIEADGKEHVVSATLPGAKAGKPMTASQQMDFRGKAQAQAYRDFVNSGEITDQGSMGYSERDQEGMPRPVSPETMKKIAARAREYERQAGIDDGPTLDVPSPVSIGAPDAVPPNAAQPPAAASSGPRRSTPEEFRAIATELGFPERASKADVNSALQRRGFAPEP